MSVRRLLVLSGLLLSGCLYHAREMADQAVAELAARPFDLAPAATEESPKPMLPANQSQSSPPGPLDVQTTAFMQAQPGDQKGQKLLEERLKIPSDIPGSETRLPNFEKLTKDQIRDEIRKMYKPLPPVQEEAKPLPGPGGKPYTLADLQEIAAGNSPQLVQAALDVQAAWGALIQARAYPNPRLSYVASPSNDGETAGVQGFFIDQVVITGGKLKQAGAAAEVDLRNAELALRRARSDLATAVRNAYFAHLVAKETIVVNKALARFTDDVYRVQEDVSESGLGAVYEPAALRAMAHQARLALKVSIDNYNLSWKQLAATIGLRQLPLSEVAGRIDVAIPYYDFDAVKEYVLRNHTDVLIARNGIDKAKFNLKRAQITPISDVEFNIGLQKDFALPPFQVVPSATVSITLPLWDQNKGNIISAEAALGRASEEPHKVELTLTNNLTTAYLAYKTNVESVEYYRRYILPDQIFTYLGARQRFFSAPPATAGVTFGDVVSAQQAMATSIGNYLTLLGNLWTSVMGVADFLQTDDLFQLSKPLGITPLPELEPLPPWPCGHSSSAMVPGAGCCTPAPSKDNGRPMPPAAGASPAPSTPQAPIALPAPSSPLPPTVRRIQKPPDGQPGS
jgi:cobalt-zinc-cadmium efflux system outer membrane protein